MPAKQTPVSVRKFTTANAAVNAEFDVARVADALHEELTRLVAKKGYVLAQGDGAGLTIDGSFVMIDEGNRFLRYLLAGMFGAARVEVEGAVKGNGAEKPFSFVAKRYAGLFGGSGERLVLSGTRTLAKKVVGVLRSV